MQGAYGGLIVVLIYGSGSGNPPGSGFLLMLDNTPLLQLGGQFIKLL